MLSDLTNSLLGDREQLLYDHPNLPSQEEQLLSDHSASVSPFTSPSSPSAELPVESSDVDFDFQELKDVDIHLPFNVIELPENLVSPRLLSPIHSPVKNRSSLLPPNFAKIPTPLFFPPSPVNLSHSQPPPRVKTSPAKGKGCLQLALPVPTSEEIETFPSLPDVLSLPLPSPLPLPEALRRPPTPRAVQLERSRKMQADSSKQLSNLDNSKQNREEVRWMGVSSDPYSEKRMDIRRKAQRILQGVTREKLKTREKELTSQLKLLKQKEANRKSQDRRHSDSESGDEQRSDSDEDLDETDDSVTLQIEPYEPEDIEVVHEGHNI